METWQRESRMSLNIPLSYYGRCGGTRVFGSHYRRDDKRSIALSRGKNGKLGHLTRFVRLFCRQDDNEHVPGMTGIRC